MNTRAKNGGEKEVMKREIEELKRGMEEMKKAQTSRGKTVDNYQDMKHMMTDLMKNLIKELKTELVTELQKQVAKEIVELKNIVGEKDMRIKEQDAKIDELE